MIAGEDGDHRRVGGKAEAHDQACAHGDRRPPGQRPDHAAEQAGHRKSSNAGGAAAGFTPAGAPSALEPDQQPDAQRDGEMREQVLEVEEIAYPLSEKPPLLAGSGREPCGGDRQARHERYAILPVIFQAGPTLLRFHGCYRGQSQPILAGRYSFRIGGG